MTLPETSEVKDWYASAGVRYDEMDPFKLMGQEAALQTLKAFNSKRGTQFRELDWSRGESAHLIELIPGQTFGFCVEGLGTKNDVADAMYGLIGDKTYYDSIAQDTVAMIINDLCTVGIAPLCVGMIVDAAEHWFKDERRSKELFNGWANACIKAGAVFGPGESATLIDLVAPTKSILNGAAYGYAKTDNLLRPDLLEADDVIILLASSGVHANSLTGMRRLAKRLPDGYLTKLSDGQSFGEAILDPTPIYSPIVEECIRASGGKSRYLHYAANITGHAWCKLMRAPQPLEYVIEQTPELQPIFRFIQEQDRITDREAYKAFNMGAGFVLFASRRYAQQVLSIAETNGIKAMIAGSIRPSSERRVRICRPGTDDLVYGPDDLKVR